MKRKNLPYAVAGLFACAAALSSHAEKIDINKLAVESLRKAGKLNAIYKAQTGQDLPASLTATAVFEGDILGRGVSFQVPSVIPENPLVLSQARVTNCSTSTVTRTVGVNKQTTNTASFSNSDTVETGREISVTVGYDSPFGASMSATASAKQSFSATKTEDKSFAETLGWLDELQVPVEAGKAVKVQFVVSEQKLSNVPYTANLILTGTAALSFQAGPEGFSWVRIAGNAAPPNVIYPGKQQNRNLAICRVQHGDRMRIGKSDGFACWFGIHELPPFVKTGMAVTSNFDLLVGSASSVRLGDAYANDAFLSDDPSRQKICMGHAPDKGWSIPGYVEGRNCVVEWDSRAHLTTDYHVLLAPASAGRQVRVRLDDHLTEAQRTFNLRGAFTGVNGLGGDYRVGRAFPASDCDTLAGDRPAPSAASAMPSAAGDRPLGAAPRLAAAVVESPDAPLPPSTTVKKVAPAKR